VTPDVTENLGDNFCRVAGNASDVDICILPEVPFGRANEIADDPNFRSLKLVPRFPTDNYVRALIANDRGVGSAPFQKGNGLRFIRIPYCCERIRGAKV
jgi:hypothetical protein